MAYTWADDNRASVEAIRQLGNKLLSCAVTRYERDAARFAIRHPEAILAQPDVGRRFRDTCRAASIDV